jgi:thiamine-monophosphate kinase
MTRIASEDDFLALVDRHFPREHTGVLLGRGDDAAGVAWPGASCVTTDLFLEDVHFRRAYFAPEDVGYKAVAVNVSDVAAMGCLPTGFVLGLVCPEAMGLDFWDGVLRGMALAAAPFDLPLVGGDLDGGAMIGIAVTIWGRPGPTGRVLTRGTCRPGDILFAVGPLGLARMGLTVLEQNDPAAATHYPVATAAHLRPTPRVMAGLALAGLDGVTAAMDVSDGLARDLPRLLAPGTGAALAIAPQACHPELAAWAAANGRDPVLELVTGGEDYALLGAVAPDDWPSVARAVPEAWPLGHVREEPGITVNGQPLAFRGFDHFG